MDKQLYMQSMEYYTAMTINKLLLQATNLTMIMLSKTRQIQKNIQYTISFIYNSNKTDYGIRSQNNGCLYRRGQWDFPGGAVVENPPASAGDTGLSPGPGRSHMPWSN